ncbi:MAG: glycosyltransferase family 4 protein [Candidatus Hodarchaeales archaeon]|jgi:glycosyltransferase involved in cell wall biosynthesis
MHLAFIEDTKLHGGTQLWVFDAIIFFLKRGHKITVITPVDGWLFNECKNYKLNMNLITYSFENIVFNSESDLNLWAQSLEKCDLAICTVHPPRDDFHCVVFTAKCIKEFKLKTILISKTGTIVPSYKKEYYLPDDLDNSKIITISKTIFKYLISNYKISEHKIKQIYQGINLDYFNQKKDYEFNSELNHLTNFSPILGCIGYLFERKGHIILIKALLKIKQDLPRVHLLIVGDGPDESLLKKETKDLGLEESVTFIPFTRDPVVVYNRIDLLILPSLSKEGLPNVILEAFAMKIPVIASDIGGISEVVKNKETGFLIKPGHVKDLAKAILFIWENKKDMELMRENVQSLIREEHDRNRQMIEFEKFFKQTLK